MGLARDYVGKWVQCVTKRHRKLVRAYPYGVGAPSDYDYKGWTASSAELVTDAGECPAGRPETRECSEQGNVSSVGLHPQVTYTCAVCGARDVDLSKGVGVVGGGGVVGSHVLPEPTVVLCASCFCSFVGADPPSH